MHTISKMLHVLCENQASPILFPALVLCTHAYTNPERTFGRSDMYLIIEYQNLLRISGYFFVRIFRYTIITPRTCCIVTFNGCLFQDFICRLYLRHDEIFHISHQICLTNVNRRLFPAENPLQLKLNRNIKFGHNRSRP